jgi:PTH1 family peptidyl-tRNA hydrolase
MNKFLIVGLGNPGDKYKETRHNIGFEILDFISDKKESKFEAQRLGDLSEISIKGKKVFLLKPSTFMNLSGKAVKYWMQQENIKIQNILIISDDLNLPLGRIRLRPSGSSGGHNGLENIESLLNSNKYPRLRIGISNPNENFNQIDFVLGKFNEEEYDLLSSEFSNIDKLITSFVISGVDQTMNNFNN